MVAPSSTPRLGLWVFLCLASCFLFGTSREPPWADAHVVYDTTRSIVDHGDLELRAPFGPRFFVEHEGHRYGVFPLGSSVTQIPGYLLFRALEPLQLTRADAVQALTTHLAPAICMAGACWIFLSLARRWGAGPRLATALTVTLAFGTIVFIYARSAYSEAFQTLALTWAIERSLLASDEFSVRRAGLLGVALGVLLNSKLVYALVLPILLVPPAAVLRRPGPRSWRAVIAFGGAFGAFLAVALLHNIVKTGNPFDSGYRETEGLFSGDLLPALYGFTFSTGKSVFLYSPPLLLAAFGLRDALRSRRVETWTIVLLTVALACVNGKFRHWHADYCWGPRHLVSLTPAMLLLSVPYLKSKVSDDGIPRWLWILAGAGLVIQVLGAAFYWDHFIRMLIAVKDQTGASGWFREMLSQAHYIPQFSPIRGHLWLLEHFLRGNSDLNSDAPWHLLVPQHADLSAQWDALRIDWWALDLAGTPFGSRTVVGLALAAGLTSIPVGRALLTGDPRPPSKVGEGS
jgi:hypothetical protein